MKPILYKIGGLALVILVPVIVVMAVFIPIIRSNKTPEVSTYRLPREFAQQEIDELVGLMKLEGEFGFYFELLDEQNIVQAAEDVYTSLKNRRSPDRMLGQVQSNQKKIKGLAMFFSSYDFTNVDLEDQPPLVASLLEVILRVLRMTLPPPHKFSLKICEDLEPQRGERS